MPLEDWWRDSARPTLADVWLEIKDGMQTGTQAVQDNPGVWLKRAAIGASAAIGVIVAAKGKERPVAPRAFISFEMEDRWARDFLVQHARDKRTDFEFVDYSVQNPFDTSWKTRCKARIARTRGTIVLIGPTTHKSSAVLWEIEETTRQGHYLFGIQVHRDRTHTVPKGLPAKNVIRWDFEQIASWLSTWT